MNLGLKGKNVFVTASTDGIGKATAEYFLKEGANIYINGRNAIKLKKCLDEFKEVYKDNFIDGFACDISSETDIIKIRDEVMKKWEKVDVLVGNLGTGKSLTKEKLDLLEWNYMLNMNLLSSVSLLREFDSLITENGGSIVLISSLSAYDKVGAPMAYAAAKKGVLALIKYSAADYAERGIRINGVSPGNIYYHGGRWEELEKENPMDVMAYIQQEVPQKRFGKVEEVAAAIVFLASNQSSFTTGAVLKVDGGQERGY